jgi:hypothetical protein
MKKFNSVLAFGDSHVAGCELSEISGLVKYLKGDVTLEEADAPGKKLAFPQIVADRLDVPCYNYSISGGSNTRSLRLLVKAIQEHPNSLVLFGYTSTDRTEFYYPKDGLYLGRDNDNFIQVGMQWYGEIAKLIKSTKMKHPVNDLFVNNLLYPYNNINELMFIVDNLCTLNASKVFHLPLFPEEIKVDDVDLFSFEGYTNYVEWCENKKFKQLPMLHYSQDAHNALAELIIKDLKV